MRLRLFYPYNFINFLTITSSFLPNIKGSIQNKLIVRASLMSRGCLDPQLLEEVGNLSGLTQKLPKNLIYRTAKTPRTPRIRRLCVSPIYDQPFLDGTRKRINPGTQAEI
jgi:hypothetical protein